MKITKRQLRRLIREERNRILHEQPAPGEQAEQMQRDQDMHSWPRIEWDSSIGELTDKWTEMEEKAFDPKDPSMTNDGELLINAVTGGPIGFFERDLDDIPTGALASELVQEVSLMTGPLGVVQGPLKNPFGRVESGGSSLEEVQSGRFAEESLSENKLLLGFPTEKEVGAKLKNGVAAKLDPLDRPRLIF